MKEILLISLDVDVDVKKIIILENYYKCWKESYKEKTNLRPVSRVLYGIHIFYKFLIDAAYYSESYLYTNEGKFATLSNSKVSYITFLFLCVCCSWSSSIIQKEFEFSDIIP